jgi:hypothetical protein
MTLSTRNFQLAALLLLAPAVLAAATPPDAEMAAAGTAIANAERVQARGPAADALAQARERFSQAQDAMGRKKYRDAVRLAEEARALGDLALARGRLVNAQVEVDEKTTRNADLRRQLLVLPGENG